MSYELPKSLTEEKLDLAAERAKALEEYTPLKGIEDVDLTDEQIDRLDYLSDAVEQIDAEIASRQAVVDERTNRAAASRAKLDAASADPEAEPEVEVETEPDPEVEVEVPDDASELIEQEQAVTASATKKAPVARRVAAKAPVVKKEVDHRNDRASIIASAEVRGFSTGQTIETMEDLALAFRSKLGGMPSVKGRGQVTNRFGVAEIHKVVPPEFMLTRSNQDENMKKIFDAAKAWSLDPKTESLTAAGGWCIPSETVYTLPTMETVSGILQLPEVGVRAGINFTRGPDFSDIYTDSGFLQTETQAEAGTAKTFIDVECPAFEEVRLDAIGYGVRAGILTNAAWPELVQRYLEGTLVAHAHKVNASKIARIAALAGTALNGVERGSALVDTLNALAVQAEKLRYAFRLDPSAVMEGFAPHWLIEVFRQDLAAQEGAETKAISDEQINGWLRVRKISLQWVYDYQDLPPTGVDWPTTVDVILYPKGTYVAGTTDVISLDAVYDTASLTVNTFTAAFFEEGIMVFSPFGRGVKITLTPLHAVGRHARPDFSIANTLTV